VLAAKPSRTSAASGSPAACARHLNNNGVTASKVEQVCPVASLNSSLMRAMLSGEISSTWVTKLNAVNDGGCLGGSWIVSRVPDQRHRRRRQSTRQLARHLQELRRALPVEYQVAEAEPHRESPPHVNLVTCKAQFLSTSISQLRFRDQACSWIGLGGNQILTSTTYHLCMVYVHNRIKW
jgi:hypothetical protein